MTPVTDLCDEFSDKLQIAEPMFTDFGGTLDFAGPISTVKCFEDNSLVKQAVAEPGDGVESGRTRASRPRGERSRRGGG